jgi:dihydrofolate reductase
MVEIVCFDAMTFLITPDVHQTIETDAIRRAVMGKVTSDISMSLDGFITGPIVGVGNGMGEDGDRLHDWMFDAKTETDAAIVDEIYASTGAVLIGKGMFDVGFEPWGDPPPFGMPVFIVTHEEREPLPMQGGTTYTFVTDGIEAALELARAAAGDKNVGIWGGANIMRQYLKAGLLDEMHIHLAPILLGGGIRLFEGLDPEGIKLRRLDSIETPGATHLRFEVVK